MKLVMQILFTLLLTALVGCSDSGSDSTGASSGSGLDSEVRVEGVVVNSILSGQVCYDRNENKVCDVDEPFSPIDSNGGFALVGKMSDSTSSPIIAAINTATGNIQARNAGSAIVLTTPLGKTLISPITTLVKAKIDSDPTLDITVAENAVKTDLGITASVDLFNPETASTVSDKSDKVFDIIELMLNTLKDKGIEFSSGLMSLIYSEINAQLPNVSTGTKEDIVNNSVADKTKEEIEEEINNIETVTNMSAENFFRTSKSLYTLDFDSNDDSYNVDFFEIGTTQAKNKRITFDESKNTGTLPGAVNAETYTVKADNGSLDININGEIQTIKSVSSKPISSVTSIPRFESQRINLSKGAVIYNLLFEQTQKIDPYSIEYLNEHMTGDPQKDHEWFNGSCDNGGYERQGDTILPTNPNWDCGTIKLNPANNTFTYRYTSNPSNVFPADTPLTNEKTGTYKENNVGYTFTADDGSVFYHFGFWLITYHTKENMAYAYFNDIAMKDIVKNWDATVLP